METNDLVKTHRLGAPSLAQRGVGNLLRARHVRRGFTLIEVMIVVVIIVVLTSLVLLGSRAARNAMKKTTADQQIKLIANAIDQYADFWAKWTYPGNVLVADRGWPDFIPGRLFARSAYQPVPFNSRVDFELEGTNSGLEHRPERDVVTEGDVEYAVECLTYALTASTGKGPYIKDEMQGALQSDHDEVYPALIGSNEPARSRGEFIDPWETPYRYFWVYRDPPATTNRSFKGFRPVPTAIVPSGGPGFGRPFYKADGFVLESAGPDMKFGNVWTHTSDSYFNEESAADNLVVMP